MGTDVQRVPLPSGRPGRVFFMRMARPWEVEFLHVHDGTEVNLVVRGCARRQMHDQVLEVGPGCLVHLPPGRCHDLLAGTADLAYWVIWSQRRWSVGGASDGMRFLHDDDRVEAERLCACVARHQGDAAGDALFPGLMAVLAQGWQRAGVSGGSRNMHPAVLAAVEYLHGRHGRVNLDVLAAQTGLSRSRLSHVFSRDLGMTMVAYRNRCRLAHVDALREARPRALLCDLAVEAGFATYMHFYRAYRQQRGVAPSAR